MSNQHYSPGMLTPSAAESLGELGRQNEVMKRQVDDLSMRSATDIFPASITSGAAGYHAWTEQWFDENGLRYTRPGGRTGTAAYEPAVLPDRSTILTFPQAVWLKRTLSNPTYGVIYEVITSLNQTLSRFVRFSLPSSLAVTDASKAGCTVDDYWGGTNPGATVTVFNLPASTNYIFGGLTGAKGVAVYDEIDSKYWIIQLQCGGVSDGITINTTTVIGGDANALIYTDGTVAQTALNTRVVSESLQLKLGTNRWMSPTVVLY